MNEQERKRWLAWLYTCLAMACYLSFTIGITERLYAHIIPSDTAALVVMVSHILWGILLLWVSRDL